MERFIGNSDAKADVKGRVVIPAAFRKILQTAGETRLILRKDIFKDCLVLYPLIPWNNELDELRAKLSKWVEDEEHFYRQFKAEVEDLEIDASGRVLIPKKYMQMAKIETDVHFIGSDYTIEIWNKEVLQKTFSPPDVFKENVKKFLAPKR